MLGAQSNHPLFVVEGIQNGLEPMGEQPCGVNAANNFTAFVGRNKDQPATDFNLWRHLRKNACFHSRIPHLNTTERGQNDSVPGLINPDNETLSTNDMSASFPVRSGGREPSHCAPANDNPANDDTELEEAA